MTSVVSPENPGHDLIFRGGGDMTSVVSPEVEVCPRTFELCYNPAGGEKWLRKC